MVNIKKETMMSKWIKATVLIVVLCCMSLQAKPLSDEHHEKRFNEMVKALDLKPMQVTEIRAHRESHHQRLKSKHDAIRSLKTKLSNEIERKTVDKAKVNKINDKIKALENEKRDMHLNGLLKMKGILSPTQFEAFKKHVEKRHPRKSGQRGDKKGWFRN